jgi:ABC-2 type transport system ATP-binding protein
MVSFTSVTKNYSQSAAPAVSDATLSVDKGAFFALLGPNGAGKTTLVKMLLDFIRPTHGAIAIDGVISRDARSRSGVGYLPENIRIPKHLTGRRYLKRQALLRNMNPGEADAKISAALDTVGMKGKEREAAKTYSKGMLQRIGLAAALLTGTKLLVLDEPVSGLDPIGIRDVRRIMETLKQQGITIILNSHLLSEVEKTCDAAAIINKGKIALVGRMADIVRDSETLEDVFMRVVEGRGPHA